MIAITIIWRLYSHSFTLPNWKISASGGSSSNSKHSSLRTSKRTKQTTDMAISSMRFRSKTKPQAWYMMSLPRSLCRRAQRTTIMIESSTSCRKALIHSLTTAHAPNSRKTSMVIATALHVVIGQQQQHYCTLRWHLRSSNSSSSMCLSRPGILKLPVTGQTAVLILSVLVL